MSAIELILDAGTYRQLREHLAGCEHAYEEAAFLFCRLTQEQDTIRLMLAEISLLPPEAFARRSGFYLELTDETRASLIKRAHDLNCCLVETHSHPGQVKAEFSWSDLQGFEEFVPHVRWRLKGLPYVAIVFGPNSFDALVWQGKSNVTSQLTAVAVDNKRLLPTGRTLSKLGTTA